MPHLNLPPTLFFLLPLPLNVNPPYRSSNFPAPLNLAHRPLIRTLHFKRISPVASISPTSSSSTPDIFALIKSQVPLSKAFSDLTPSPTLIPTGPDTFKLCCPFHPDKTPSLHISDSKQIFHCFGCNAGGTIIDFEILRTRDPSIHNALRSLASRYPQIANMISKSPRAVKSVQMAQMQPQEEKQKVKRWREHVDNKRLTKDVLRILESVYQDTLWSVKGASARDYLINQRGLSEQTLRTYGVGWAPEGFDFALKGLGRMGYSEDQIVEAGAARRSEKGMVYDFFRGRVVTPIRDRKGYVVGMGGRILGNEEEGVRKTPKYVNSQESPVFKKGELLFGEDVVRRKRKQAINEEKKEGAKPVVVVVEGYMDVMALYEHTGGKLPCVATMGTAMTPRQLDMAGSLLEDQISGKVVINFDGDEAGIAAMERLCDSVIPMCGCAYLISVAFLPPDMKDPDEFLRATGSGEEYMSYVKAVAMPWYEWRGKRYVIEEMAVREMEEDGIPSDEIENRFEGSVIARNRELVEIRPEDGSPDVLHNEEMKMLNDEMLVAFGAPMELLKRAKERRERFKVIVSKNVIEVLAKIVETGQRCIPGFNYPDLVKRWADTLTCGKMALLTAVYARILNRAEELSQPWKNLAPVMQLRWMDPAEDVLGMRRQHRKGKKKRPSLLNPSLVVPTAQEKLEYFSSPKRQKKSLAIQQAQERFLIPYLKARTSKAALKLTHAPRQAAEEVILRCLIFASEAKRVEALDALLTVMLHCEERDFPFWTSLGREKVFEYLADVEGELESEDMAASLEGESWWCAETEELFLGIEDETDKMWKELRMIELKHPVEMVEVVADAIAGMAGKVAQRMVLETTDRVAREAGKSSDAELVKKAIAELEASRESLNSSWFLRPSEKAEWEEMKRKEEQREADEEESKRLLEQIRSESVPYPEHLRPDGRDSESSPLE